MIHDQFIQLPIIGRFAIVFGLVVLLPRLAERIRLPGVVGLIAGGIVLGPSLTGLLDPKSGTIDLFADLGKLLLMFFAGYEVDMEQFRRVRLRAMGFGVLTFSFPLAVGTAIGLAFGYGANSSVLIGSLLASHTLLALPMIGELGLLQRDSVLTTIGATIVTDISAMLVLAICLSIHMTGFSREHLAVTVVELAVYVPMVVFGFSAFVRWMFKVFKPSAELRLAALILMMTAAALAAEAIELEGIVGAFLAGLAVRRGLGESEAGETLSVLSHTLFIPVFFLSTGFLVDTHVFLKTLVSDAGLVAAIVGGLLGAKYLAAQTAGALFRMGRDDRLMMWSLSVPQVAATLAAALVAYQSINGAGERLLDERVVNTVIVLVLATSVIGPVVGRRVGVRLANSSAPRPPS